MQNIIAGPVVIAICLMLTVRGYQAYRNDNYSFVVFSIMAVGVLLRLFVFSDLYLHEWDERYHALVAKNLIRHPMVPTLYDDPVLPYNYKNWSGNHIWLHKLPVPLWLMSFSMWAFGANEIALRLPSFLLSSLGIYLTFRIGRYLFTKNVGLISAILYAIHGLIIELTGGRSPTDHIDIHFMVFILVSVFFLIRFLESGRIYFNLISGFFMGMALLSKYLPALIVVPVWLLLVIESERLNRRRIVVQFTLFLISGLFLFALWQVYIFTRFPQEASWETNYNILHITRILDGHSGSFLYHFDKMRMIYGELVYLPVLWFVYYLFKPQNQIKRFSLFLWFFLPYLFFSLARTRMQAYTLFAAPALFIIIAVFFTRLTDFRNQSKKYHWPIIIVQFLLLALPVRYSIERIKPFEKLERNPAWALELRELAKKIPLTQKTVLFNVDRPIETMFYINCTAYRKTPGKQELEEIIDKGYTVYINRPGEISGDLGSLPGIRKIHLEHN